MVTFQPEHPEAHLYFNIGEDREKELSGAVEAFIDEANAEGKMVSDGDFLTAVVPLAQTPNEVAYVTHIATAIVYGSKNPLAALMASLG